MLSTVSPVIAGEDEASPQPTSPVSVSIRANTFSETEISTPDILKRPQKRQIGNDGVNPDDFHGAEFLLTPIRVYFYNKGKPGGCQPQAVARRGMPPIVTQW